MLSTIPPQPPTLHGPVSKTDIPILDKSPREPLTIDELVRSRASGAFQPVISYPRTGIEYVDYSLNQLDIFAFRVAKVLADRIPPRASSAETPAVIALLGPSDLNYLVMMLSLAKLGHSGLLLSTRISVDAYVSLLDKTQSRHIFIHSSFRDTAADIKQRVPGLRIDEIPTEEAYQRPISEPVDTNLVPYLDPVAESKHIAWIIHSSGSTGPPKPIFHTQAAALQNYSGHMNMSGFVTLPLYHNHGISCLFRTIHACKQLHLYNAEIPLTRQYLLEIMRTRDVEVFYGVPYALKLLAESPEGISALAGFKAVMFGGSACPDALGNLLVDNGVHLISHYGSTETGQLMMSARPREDKGWDWLRPSETVKKFLRFEERFPGIYELLCLDGWPSKVASNRPDGSYATKDLFVKHPTMEAYKYYARLDDTIVLVNGEKVNPLDLEGRVRQSSAVAEAIAFGAGKASIGLAVLRAPDTESSDEAIIQDIWPAVQQANESLPAFGQLSRSMIRVLPAETQYPRTDKGTVIRPAFYKAFDGLIEEAYAADDALAGTLVLSEPELRAFLREQLLQMVPLKNPDLLTDDADFFSLGMDSLQATQLRSILMTALDTNGHTLGLNIAFERPTVASLARYLDALRTGAAQDNQPIVEQMRALIDKYSHFEPQVPLPGNLKLDLDSPGRCILLTGTTGTLGIHIAAQLSLLPTVRKIHCPIRAPDPSTAHTRLHESLRRRRLHTLPAECLSKLIALPSPTLNHPTLSLPPATYAALQSETTDIIHSAWSVIYNLRLTSQADENLPGLRNLLSLMINSPRGERPTFNFCSSVSSVREWRVRGGPIPEEVPDDLSAAQGMGYAQSKLVAEHVCLNAAVAVDAVDAATTSTSTTLTPTPTPSKAQETMNMNTNIKKKKKIRILRIGQITADSIHGIWNPTEAIPLILQSALTVGALPTLDDFHRWLPVDVVAGAVVDISLMDSDFFPQSQSQSQSQPQPQPQPESESKTNPKPTLHENENQNQNRKNGYEYDQVYQITNPTAFHWTTQLLPALRAAGLPFQELNPHDWLLRVRGVDDPVRNPPFKLVEFFERKYGYGEG
ncbi:acetyl-CoA synthetase-like protein [Aspergillus heteromorphus CBS 117.55]|uniref:Acetyl-CoA synthetase-like protein n=1 Tax=Aspergillus heteromorphus CBS 117.55 TaxID=1448321 RepID=A0A317VYV0_9EURO|nr:acetyl-CoA synthetase-like protein [Aspergillus heteromorphus CBS 117.55]PWY78192.1 acetyl-CoA synthetase-like protein [Aspergillus heteromorphus CBS 117.55]